MYEGMQNTPLLLVTIPLTAVRLWNKIISREVEKRMSVPNYPFRDNSLLPSPSKNASEIIKLLPLMDQNKVDKGAQSDLMKEYSQHCTLLVVRDRL